MSAFSSWDHTLCRNINWEESSFSSVSSGKYKIILLPDFLQFNFSLFQSQDFPWATIRKSSLIGTFFLINNLQSLSCEYLKETEVCVYIVLFLLGLSSI